MVSSKFILVWGKKSDSTTYNAVLKKLEFNWRSCLEVEKSIEKGVCRKQRNYGKWAFACGSWAPQMNFRTNFGLSLCLCENCHGGVFKFGLCIGLRLGCTGEKVNSSDHCSNFSIRLVPIYTEPQIWASKVTNSAKFQSIFRFSDKNAREVAILY